MFRVGAGTITDAASRVGHEVDDRFPARHVAIGRHRRDAELVGHHPHRDPLETDQAFDAHRGVDEDFLVDRPLLGHVGPRPAFGLSLVLGES